ncbi:MAG: asparagine synthase (glutamine-hydrolyzing) [Polyangiaceae bacterium]
MCGIAGWWDSKERHSESAARVLAEMCDAIRYRGPDDHGAWLQAGEAALGQRRLSIVDLSPEGHQPMVSRSGDWVITYNGEVYNFRELRRELEADGSRFRGHSDTEVMLEAIDQWGLEAAVQRFIGMFAFAAWHRPTRKLHLCRDRLGIKPLFYAELGRHGVAFASELWAIRRHPDFHERINAETVASILRYSTSTGNDTIFDRCRKVPPGTILTFNSPDLPPRATAYWSALTFAEPELAPDEKTLLDSLDALLADSVARRMIADVPVGAFLSGGIDSSLVTAYMQAVAPGRIKTFSIGMQSALYDEAAQARAVAQHLGTDHTELYLSTPDIQQVVPLMARMYDEPFADSSQVPTFLVSRLARKSVTVALTGDGGDEVFGGYNRHVWAPRVWDVSRRLPRIASRALATQLEALTRSRLIDGIETVIGRLPARYRLRIPSQKLRKIARVLHSETREQLFDDLCATSPLTLHQQTPRPRALPRVPGSFAEQMMIWDLTNYLPDDILTKVDRASMAVSLETRVPLLDHRVVEHAARCPASFKIKDGRGKWPLRELLYRRVPRALVDRPKMGFGVPIEAWLRHELRDWAEDLLSVHSLKASGLLDVANIRVLWRQHLEGSHDWAPALWTVLALQAWLRVKPFALHEAA